MSTQWRPCCLKTKAAEIFTKSSLGGVSWTSPWWLYRIALAIDSHRASSPNHEKSSLLNNWPLRNKNRKNLKATARPTTYRPTRQGGLDATDQPMMEVQCGGSEAYPAAQPNPAPPSPVQPSPAQLSVQLATSKTQSTNSNQPLEPGKSSLDTLLRFVFEILGISHPEGWNFWGADLLRCYSFDRYLSWRAVKFDF